jgi:hypothetical protein
MKTGYLAELDARAGEMTSKKAELESHYMVEKSDEEIEQDEAMKSMLKNAVDSVEKLLPAFTTTCRSVKLAIESRLPSIRCKTRAFFKMVTCI